MTNILILVEDLEVKDHQTLTLTKYFYTTALFRYKELHFVDPIKIKIVHPA